MCLTLARILHGHSEYKLADEIRTGTIDFPYDNWDCLTTIHTHL